ncbi:hypothetical protein Patl1_09710 [Pistacia atlantica]|uniref:Uncharacterized protein n=1 Tax=Pistacia atlantica TaxID=434234 RepID=A0ACC1A6V8_9ROSI|nr:hypothetical protein Patl1_09710 [Pistacia atlantica]
MRQSRRLLELQSLKQLRVLGMNINEKSEISENECNVLTKLEKLKVLVIDADDCKDKSVFENLDRLSPPPSLKELYLKRYRHETLPKWINPKQLSSLLYLRLEHVDAIQLQMSTTSESEGISTSKWKLEGLRLKYMAYLQLDLKSLEQDLPSLNYVESHKDLRLSSMASNESSTSDSSSSAATSSILPTQLHHFITIKLTKDNYLLWRAQLIPYLRQNLFGYLDGSIPCPPITIPSSTNTSISPPITVPSSTNTSIHIPNPAYIHWSQQDQIILSAILSSLTESLLTQIIGLTTSRDVSLALEKTFSSTSSARILSIRFQLSTLKKASLTITDYFTKVKQLSDTLSTISHPLSS